MPAKRPARSRRAESKGSVLSRRGSPGIYQHVSARHLKRYVGEFAASSSRSASVSGFGLLTGAGTWIKAALDGPEPKAESRRLVLHPPPSISRPLGSCQYPVKQFVGEVAEPVDPAGLRPAGAALLLRAGRPVRVQVPSSAPDLLFG